MFPPFIETAEVATTFPACAEPGAAITIWRARVEGGHLEDAHALWWSRMERACYGTLISRNRGSKCEGLSVGQCSLGSSPSV
jgi:hypothetical protein